MSDVKNNLQEAAVMSNSHATDSSLFNNTSPRSASSFELIRAHPTLLGLLIEVHSIILEYLLVAPGSLVCQPPDLAEADGVLEDFIGYKVGSGKGDQGDGDTDDDDEFDCSCVDCYAYPFRQGEDESLREPEYRLPTVLEQGQTRIC